MNNRSLTRTYFLLTAFLAGLTFLHHYGNPLGTAWDEAHYIPDAEKYIEGVFFTETHPPLGKMLFALGEVLIDANDDHTQFLSADRLSNDVLPDDFSSAGFRLVSTLLAWATALVLFAIFMALLKKPLDAFLLTFLYSFDTAFVVQGRLAVLEGPQVFFAAVAIFLFLKLIQHPQKHVTALSVGLGISIGAAMMVKINGLVLILLLPAFVLATGRSFDSAQDDIARAGEWKSIRYWNTLPWKQIGISLATIVVTILGIWSLHFNLLNTRNVNLPHQGYFSLRAENRAALDAGTLGNPLRLPGLIHDWWSYQWEVHTRMNTFDECNPDEIGAPVWSWPFGGRATHYVWGTNDHTEYQYVIMLGNPVVWIGSTIALILFLWLFLQRYRQKETIKNAPVLLTMTVLYMGYMIVMASAGRVLYMQHYLLPLLFLLILVGGLLSTIPASDRRTNGIMLISLAAFAWFMFFWPLTYHQPISDAELEKRALLPWWDLRCAECELEVPESCKQ